jgi:UDP-glucose 6-dehydrogenase
LSPKEAEFCKYFNNCYNALLITFANSFYTICKEVGVDYAAVKEACTKRKHINDIYLDCNENMRGFGGVCLPKDTKAMDHLCKANNTDVHLFENILEENEKYKTTVFPGMRES